MEEVSELELSRVLEQACEASKTIMLHEDQLKKLFNARIMIGATYQVEHLILMAKFKFATSLLVRFAHSFEAFEQVESIAGFDEFNANMRSVVTNIEKNHTKTLA